MVSSPRGVKDCTVAPAGLAPRDQLEPRLPSGGVPATLPPPAAPLLACLRTTVRRGCGHSRGVPLSASVSSAVPSRPGLSTAVNEHRFQAHMRHLPQRLQTPRINCDSYSDLAVQQ